MTLIAHPDSRTPAPLIGYGVAPHRGWYPRVRELLQVGASLLALRSKVDVIHSFGRLAALAPVLPLRTVKKIQSYQRAIPWGGVRRATRIGRGSVWFTGCSTSLYASDVRSGEAAHWRTVFNCVDASTYEAVTAYPAMRPSRFSAASSASRARTRPCRSPGPPGAVSSSPATSPTRRTFSRRSSRTSTTAWSPTSARSTTPRRTGCSGPAAALLMPIEWDEPFGIVMAEAFACGTPVIGFARGSVPEVVRDGVNGFVVTTVDEAVKAVDAAAGDRPGRRAPRLRAAIFVRCDRHRVRAALSRGARLTCDAC